MYNYTRINMDIYFIELHDKIRLKDIDECVNIINRYVKDKNILYKYLTMICLLDIGKSSPFRFWEIWQLRKTDDKNIRRVLQIIMESDKCYDLHKYIHEYYFFGSDELEFTKYNEKNKIVDDLYKLCYKSISIFEQKYFKAMVILHFNICSKINISKREIIRKVSSDKLYNLSRLDNNQKIILESSYFWMNIDSKKDYIVKNTKYLSKLITSYQKL